MDPKDLELLSNAAVPENIRTAIAQSLLASQSAKASLDLEHRKLDIDQRKFIWNTPIVAALTGLITLSATFIFDRLTKKDQVTNTITIEQVKREIMESEVRLKQQLDERTKKTVAEIDTLTREREFQYKIVTDELADKGKTNVQRAAILLFLARAGVLTTLKADELQKMAEEQKTNPAQDIIPQLKPVGGAPILSLQPVAGLSEAPWQVALVRHGTRDLFCNGVLVSEQWVLTAAHCVDGPGNDPAKLDVVAGTHTYKSGGEQIGVVAIHTHPQWNNNSLDSNAALLKLKSASGLGKPLPIVESEDAAAMSQVRVTGWGSIHELGPTLDNIQYADIPVVSNAVCNGPNSYNGRITSNMLCAGQAAGGADVCQGASGSPAKISVRGKDYVVGIVSHGEGCGRPGKYGVYTRVSAISSWAKRTMTAN
jgi:V8-like Glu-specific endopeptidase